ncbi:MAG: hypothetical protein ACHQ51_14715 [Elusimicrobiota bacterium]
MLAAAMAWIAGKIWTEPAVVAGVRIGAAAAWASSSVSVAWLLWARGRSMKIFWWSFGGGMALRAAVLAALFVWGLTHKGSSLEGLALSYVFTLLATLLTLEIRHMRL